MESIQAGKLEEGKKSDITRRIHTCVDNIKRSTSFSVTGCTAKVEDEIKWGSIAANLSRGDKRIHIAFCW